MKDKNKKLGATLRVLMLSLCGAVLGLNLYMFNANNLVGNKLPMPFGYGAAVVLSGSMEPTLSTGDLIVVKEVDSYAVDDVVVYQDGHSLVVHRIIEIDGENIITQGDANNTPDTPIEATALKGTVVAHLPAVGNVVSFLKTPIGIISIIGLTIFTAERSFRKEKESDYAERQKIIDEIKRLKDEL